MKVQLTIPDYDGNALDVVWNNNSELGISKSNDEICIFLNKEGMQLLTQQMIYMLVNDLPIGSHVHYDDFIIGNEPNMEKGLIIEKHNGGFYLRIYT